MRPSIVPRLATILTPTELWTALWEGRERIVASYCSDSECQLELEPVARPQPLNGCVAETLERLLHGQSQKFIGLDVGCSASTVATRAKRALEHIGLSTGPSNLPAPLLMLAQVAWGTLPGLRTRLLELPGHTGRRLLSARRPDPRRLHLFTPAEAKLVDMMIEGRARREMAFDRGTSMRTIANQLAQIYRKIGVSSRIPLLLRLMQLEQSSLSTDEQAHGSGLVSNPCERACL